jgi:hypothetical protein
MTMFWAALFTLCVNGTCFYTAKIDAYQPTTTWRTEQECIEAAPAAIDRFVRETIDNDRLRALVTRDYRCVPD